MALSTGSKNPNEIKLAFVYFGVTTVIILLASAVLGSFLLSIPLPFLSYLQDNKYTSEQFGFSFSYPVNYSAHNDTMFRDTVLVSPITSGEDDDLLVRSVWITIDEETETALDWLESENSNHKIDYGYEKRVIGGQEAFMLYGSDGKVINWVYFDSPDRKWRISIANLPSKSEVPEIKRIFEKVVESFRF